MINELVQDLYPDLELCGLSIPGTRVCDQFMLPYPSVNRAEFSSCETYLNATITVPFCPQKPRKVKQLPAGHYISSRHGPLVKEQSLLFEYPKQLTRPALLPVSVDDLVLSVSTVKATGHGCNSEGELPTVVVTMASVLSAHIDQIAAQVDTQQMMVELISSKQQSFQLQEQLGILQKHLELLWIINLEMFSWFHRC